MEWGLAVGGWVETGARQLVCRLRIPYLAIKVSDYTGKAKTLNHTEELYLKARLFKTRVADCTAQVVARVG